MNSQSNPLLTDLYQLNMLQAYLDQGMTGTAVFELFVRKLPAERGFLMVAGLETALDCLENLRFSPEELTWLSGTGRFGTTLLSYLGQFRFSGDVHAVPEGTVVFANEPILRITASLPQAQLVETRLINILHFQTLIASKAARMVLLAPHRLLVDFGLRRAHGADAGLLATRASYIAGFSGSAAVLADKQFGIPIYGTMAHSFIEAFDSETQAFESFAHARPQNLVLLIDSYDTERAARKVVALAPKLRAAGITILGVRLDSGDLVTLSKRVRRILDDGGLADVTIFASGGIDENMLAAFNRDDAPIDGVGIGTNLTTSSDVPALDCAYKLQEYAGLPRRKTSPGKATWPGRKQVWRRYGADGRMVGDILSTEEDTQPGEPLLHPVMKGGRLLEPPPTLADMRARAIHELALLPEPLRRLEPGASYPVKVAAPLLQLTADVDRRRARQEAKGRPTV